MTRRGPSRPGRLSRILTPILSAASAALYRGPLRRAISGALERNRRVTHPVIALGRGAAGLSGLRLAFLSDVHLGNYFGADDWVRVCERVAQESPDLVCLGGDLVSAWEEEALELRKGLALLAPPLGVFAVPGNHEYWATPDPRVFVSVLEESGIELLVNRGVRIARGGATLWLCGVDDLRRGAPDVAAALAGRLPDEPAVLLSHQPDLFPEAVLHGVDLQISGHTHGGQIVLGGWAPITHSRYGLWTGRYARAGAQLYVSRGVGTTALPLRIGAPGEIAMLELEVR
ncbi:MAG TPA: metallophosphoesterase [Myxococcota bacterium]|nr:metallophosphoesterase [Myxococcota bacterium]